MSTGSIFAINALAKRFAHLSWSTFSESIFERLTPGTRPPARSVFRAPISVCVLHDGEERRGHKRIESCKVYIYELTFCCRRFKAIYDDSCCSCCSCCGSTTASISSATSAPHVGLTAACSGSFLASSAAPDRHAPSCTGFPSLGVENGLKSSFHLWVALSQFLESAACLQVTFHAGGGTGEDLAAILAGYCLGFHAF